MEISRREEFHINLDGEGKKEGVARLKAIIDKSRDLTWIGYGDSRYRDVRIIVLRDMHALPDSIKSGAF